MMAGPGKGTPQTPLHLGLTGSMASGKGEVVNALIRRGFRSISLSDMVRREAARAFSSGTPISRDRLQAFGNRMRSEKGAGWLGVRVREEILSLPDRRWVIDGIRNPAEIRELKQLKPFFLIGVTADRGEILRRIGQRRRESDRLQTRDIEASLEREWGRGEPDYGQQVGRCMELADFTLENNGTLQELHRKTDALVRRMEVME